jgi:hypothetical protein
MKQFYHIPCTWTVAGTMVIEAENLAEAIFEAENNAPLPTDADYVDASFEVNNQLIPLLNKNLTNEEKQEHCQEVIRF